MSAADSSILLGIRSLTGYSDAPVYHLGIYREKVSLQPVECQSLVEPCLVHVTEQ